MDEDKLSNYEIKLRANKCDTETGLVLIKMEPEQLILRIRQDMLLFGKLFLFYCMQRIEDRIYDEIRLCYDIFNFRYLYDKCQEIIKLKTRDNSVAVEEYANNCEKALRIKELIVRKDSSSIEKLATEYYNKGFAGLEDDGG